MTRKYTRLLSVVLVLCGCGSEVDGVTTSVPASPDAVGGLVAAPVPATTVGAIAYRSSTRLNVSWAVPARGRPIRYLVSWTDQVTKARSSSTTPTLGVNLSELKAGTPYRIDVTACTTDACADTSVTTITVTTPGEVWQLQGNGASVAGLARIVSDGNVKLHVLRYGQDAPPAQAGRLLMYYGPIQGNAKGLAAGLTAAPASAGSSSSYLSFTSRAGTSGLVSPASASTLVRHVNTGQGVPLSAAAGGRIRLFYEATDPSNRTRILSVDSQDGYAGLDFNAGPSTVCATAPDYAPGGGCAPSVVIGLEGDAVNPNARITNARQHKIGYPTQSDWRWDGSPGTYMVFTTDALGACSTFPQNHGYAVWSGMRWEVQYDAGGCPRLFKSMQAAHPLHLGGARYKLYYGDPSDASGRVTTSQLPFLGPKKLMYADGALTGNATRVDFEDWEGTAAGRIITFLWPDGSVLNATARGYIDDFSVVAPTADLALQVFYVAITDGIVAPFTSAAVLINP